MWQAIWAVLFTLPFALWVWAVPNWSQALWLFAIAAFAVGSHYTMAWALRLADVGAVEPTTFMRLVWGAMLGLVFFGEVPNLFTIAGGLVVLGAILYIARRERREGKAKMAAGLA